MVTVYVLGCEKGKYYVGTSDKMEFKMQDHFDVYSGGEWLEWTFLYKPICVIELHHNCDKYDVDKYTFMYMDLYGIDNVRGGSFTEVDLDEQDRRAIMKVLKGSNKTITGSTSRSCCYRCGGAGHYADRCYEKYDIGGPIDDDHCDDIDDLCIIL
jgi:hypothetical protein